MKKRLFWLIFFSAAIQSLSAQITITKNDFAKARDTIVISNPANLNDFDYTIADTNYLWDYSELLKAGQTVKKYYAVSQTGVLYAVYFSDVSFNPNRANMADDASLSLPALITSSDAYNFYDRNDNEFKQVGIGSTLNGVPTPFRFEDDDEIYTFPLSYGNIDTSTARYNIDIPSVVNYTYRHTRINVVDGWGTLITPLDTFEVIRLKSTLRIRDSVFVDSQNFGFGFNRPVETQYKWLAKDKKYPVLQVNTQGIGSNTFVSSAFYQDTVVIRPNSVIDISNSNTVMVYPNPAKNILLVNAENIQWQNAAFIDVSGKTIDLPFEVTGNNELAINFQHKNLPAGWYTLKLGSNDSVFHKLILVLP
jgi:hypothetical protein